MFSSHASLSLSRKRPMIVESFFLFRCLSLHQPGILHCHRVRKRRRRRKKNLPSAVEMFHVRWNCQQTKPRIFYCLLFTDSNAGHLWVGIPKPRFFYLFFCSTLWHWLVSAFSKHKSSNKSSRLLQAAATGGLTTLHFSEEKAQKWFSCHCFSLRSWFKTVQKSSGTCVRPIRLHRHTSSLSAE